MFKKKKKGGKGNKGQGKVKPGREQASFETAGVQNDRYDKNELKIQTTY